MWAAHYLFLNHASLPTRDPCLMKISLLRISSLRISFLWNSLLRISHYCEFHYFEYHYCYFSKLSWYIRLMCFGGWFLHYCDFLAILGPKIAVFSFLLMFLAWVLIIWRGLSLLCKTCFLHLLKYPDMSKQSITYLFLLVTEKIWTQLVKSNIVNILASSQIR